MTMERLQGMLGKDMQTEEIEDVVVNALLPEGDESEKTKKSKKKKDGKNTVRRALSNGASEYGAQLVEHIIQQSRIDGSMLASQVAISGKSQFMLA
jgi:hypothetical protein